MATPTGHNPEPSSGIPAEFVIALDCGRPPAKRRGRKRTDDGGQKRSKRRAS